MRDSGQLENPSPAQPKDEDAGRPEDSSPGAAKGCGVRGNPKTHNKPSRKMQGKRQLGTFIKRLNGTMHDPMSYQITRRTPETFQPLALPRVNSQFIGSCIGLSAFRSDCRLPRRLNHPARPGLRLRVAPYPASFGLAGDQYSGCPSSWPFGCAGDRNSSFPESRILPRCVGY